MAGDPEPRAWERNSGLPLPSRVRKPLCVTLPDIDRMPGKGRELPILGIFRLPQLPVSNERTTTRPRGRHWFVARSDCRASRQRPGAAGLLDQLKMAYCEPFARCCARHSHAGSHPCACTPSLAALACLSAPT
jgi:hypothetical protein